MKTNLQVLGFKRVQLFLHLTDVAGGFGHLGSFQVTLGQELLDVLLLFFERFLECGGAGDFARIPGRRLRQLWGGGWIWGRDLG